MRGRRKWIYGCIGAVLLILILLILFVPSLRAIFAHLFQLKTIGQIRGYVLALGFWGPVILILLMILHSVTFIPSEVITLADLAIFGPFWGMVYSWVGSMLGGYFAFYLARLFGRPIVDRFVSERMLLRFDEFVQKHGTGGLLVLRLIPFVSFNALNYVCGFTAITFWQFTWTMGIGILPLNILFALLYQSVVGLKYALIGLTIAGILLLVILFLKTQLDKRRKPNDNLRDGFAKNEAGNSMNDDKD